MSETFLTQITGLHPQYQTYQSQTCFVGYSYEASWRADVVSACNSVLPEFGLVPWYASDYFDPTQPLREKVLELIANACYGIYDLSYWYNDKTDQWIMPRNVLIEFGIALALNRPMLLVRHAKNQACGLKLPTCLEGLAENILEFSGGPKLKRILKEHLSQLVNTPPEQDWWNRYCLFGNRICQYREAHPRSRQWGYKQVLCHISDGPDVDRDDFREVVEEVLERFNDVSYEYLDALSILNGYDLLLCTLCQRVRSTPFALYRITPHTPVETFIAIGISLALEKQFAYNIPKILLTESAEEVPSLLSGYEVVITRSDQERMDALRKFMPLVIQKVRKVTWKPRPLPFIEIVQRHVERPKLGDEPIESERQPASLGHVFQFNELISDPGEFFGRVRERETLISRTSKGTSTSIVGPRRIGKTWLLNYLRIVASTTPGPTFRIGYIDASSPKCQTVAGFTSTALEVLGVSIQHEDRSNIVLDKLEQAIKEMRSKSLLPVLCIDEFEAFGNLREFDLTFFSGLRALAQLGLGLVIASKNPLIDIVGDIGKTSGFFNIFEQLRLKPFNAEEAEAFARDKAIQAEFTDQEQNYLLEYGQENQWWPPLRIQLAGKMLLDDKTFAVNEKDSTNYRPNDPSYWRDFEKRLEEHYQAVAG